MADPVPAGPDIYKTAALQALATGGSQAKASLDATKANMEAARTAAVGQALQEAGRLNVSQAGKDQLSNTIGAPTTRAEGTLQTRFDPRITQAAAAAGPTAAVFDAKYQLNLPKTRSGGGGGGRGSSGGSSTSSGSSAGLGATPVQTMGALGVGFRDDQATQGNLNYALQAQLTPSQVKSKLQSDFKGNAPAISYYLTNYQQAYNAQAAAAKKK